MGLPNSLVCLLTVLYLLVQSGALPIDSTSRNCDQVAEILDKVPEEDQKDFLRAALYEGYKLQMQKEDDHQGLQLSDDEIILLFNYVLDNADKITDEKKISEYSNVVCFPQGCVDLGDPGIHPVRKI